jgi:hypothetical protein
MDNVVIVMITVNAMTMKCSILFSLVSKREKELSIKLVQTVK